MRRSSSEENGGVRSMSTEELQRLAQMRPKSDTRLGRKKGGNVFMAQEERFHWQKPINDFDAFYTLPSSMARQSTAFGSSTRSDWENTWRNKKDGDNPNAGPGQNGTPNARNLSTNPNLPSCKFALAPRNTIDAKKLAPGPKYDLEGVFKHGRDGKIPISFNKDRRKPLTDNESVDAYYVPRLSKGKSITIGARRKEKKLGLGEHQSPGPIYDLYKYGFGCALSCGRTGPSFSFSASRAPRFKYSE